MALVEPAAKDRLAALVVTGDTADEGAESFSSSLSSPTGAFVGVGHGEP